MQSMRSFFRWWQLTPSKSRFLGFLGAGERRSWKTWESNMGFLWNIEISELCPNNNALMTIPFRNRTTCINQIGTKTDYISNTPKLVLRIISTRPSFNRLSSSSASCWTTDTSVVEALKDVKSLGIIIPKGGWIPSGKLTCWPWKSPIVRGD